MKNSGKQSDPLLKKSMDLAIAVIEAIDNNNELKKSFLSNQLIRSGTAVGALVREAQNAESRRDFIHKIKIAAKEAEETRYWLLICEGLYVSYKWETVLGLVNEVNKILGKSLSTAITNQRCSSVQ
jgi:four helix bundle protein